MSESDNNELIPTELKADGTNIIYTLLHRSEKERKYIRLNNYIYAEAAFCNSVEFKVVKVIDISAGGICFSTTEKFKVSDNIIVSLFIGEYEKYIKIPSVIIRTFTEDEIHFVYGCEFLEMDFEAGALLIEKLLILYRKTEEREK